MQAKTVITYRGKKYTHLSTYEDEGTVEFVARKQESAGDHVRTHIKKIGKKFALYVRYTNFE
jgi:hypothetical protein